MRYSYVLHFPDNTPPFDRDMESRWRSFLGEFVRPIADKHPDLLFWCSFYNSYAKFRVVSDVQEVHDFIAARKTDLKLRFDPSEEAADTLLSDLGGTRFIDHSLGATAPEQKVIRECRAMLSLRFLCSTIRLHLDSLVSVNNKYWEYQPTPDKQNPLGNNFESLVHLLSNVTRFEFDVHTTAGTVWQQPHLVSSIRCRLWS